MLEVSGWIGSIMFALCGLPQAIKIWQTKSANDLSWMFLVMWAIGEVLTSSYVLITNIKLNNYQYPLLINYILNGIVLIYLIYGKIKYDTAIL